MILDRNGGKFSYKWLGPYVAENISKKSLFTLCNQSDVELSKKYNERPDLINQIFKTWKVYLKKKAIHLRFVT